MDSVYIFGHKNPDTDAVTSAISLSYLKNKIGMNTKPMILSRVNKETSFVLRYFNIPVPEYLEDVKLQIKDVNYHKGCYVSEYDSILKVYNYMLSKNVTGVPIVDDNQKFIGLLTSKIIGNELINGKLNFLNTSYENILEVLNGEAVLQFDKKIEGNVSILTSKNSYNNETIVITDSCDISYLSSNIKLVIVASNDIESDFIDNAKKNHIGIIKTNYNLFYTSKLINLSNYVKNLLQDTRNVCFNEKCYYDEFKEKCIKFGYNNYAVIDDNNTCLGLIRITDINKFNKKQVILVDHNDINQSVEGLEEAEILEIIDHHNLGLLTTNMPINFRNMIVGSTNTIIYSLYSENNIDIPSNIAGIMLAGIISDTLKFTSPTTTELDRYVARNLQKIANIDIDLFASEMFKEGTNLNGKARDEIVNEDMKTYEIGNKKIKISQVFTLSPSEILKDKDEYIKILNDIKNNDSNCTILMCITDIIKNGSYILFDDNSKDIISNMFGIDNVEQGYFFANCLSRKKQLVPLIMSSVK